MPKEFSVIKVGANNTVELNSMSDLGYISLQEEIGGYITVVHSEKLPNQTVMLVDEEGMLKRLPINKLGCYYYDTAKHGRPIVGDVLLVGVKESEYDGMEFVGLNDEQISAIKNDLIFFELDWK